MVTRPGLLRTGQLRALCNWLGPGDPRVPVTRGAVLAATAEISDLVALLRGASPVGAREIAVATQLLTC